MGRKKSKNDKDRKTTSLTFDEDLLLALKYYVEHMLEPPTDVSKYINYLVKKDAEDKGYDPNNEEMKPIIEKLKTEAEATA